jgi:hypothetical protein
LGYENIELYGVEMETDTEYRYQRDGVTFWLGVALGKGCKVTAHCSIFDMPLYGYEGDVKLDYGLFVKQITDIGNILPPLQKDYDIKRKFVADLIKQFTETGEGGQDIRHAVKTQLETGIKFGNLDGAKQENERYKAKADLMNKTTGEFIFSRQEFESARQALQKKQAELMTQSNMLAGQTEAAFIQCENVTNRTKRKKRVDGFVKVLDQYIKSTITTAMLIGGLNENQRYINLLDEKIKAAGGSKSEAVMLEAYANRA